MCSCTNDSYNYFLILQYTTPRNFFFVDTGCIWRPVENSKGIQ